MPGANFLAVNTSPMTLSKHGLRSRNSRRNPKKTELISHSLSLRGNTLGPVSLLKAPDKSIKVT